MKVKLRHVGTNKLNPEINSNNVSLIFSGGKFHNAMKMKILTTATAEKEKKILNLAVLLFKKCIKF